MGVEVPPQPSARLAREEFVVLCPANLVAVKGHRYLIEAWSHLNMPRQAKLLIAGDGELRDALNSLVAKLGLGKTVEFLGHLPHASLLAMYRRAEVDLVVLPSLDLGGGVHEGIPVSLIEAMAYGVPVISTNTGGIPELLDNGAGVMVPQADSAALAAAIVKLIRTSEVVFEQGAQGRLKALQQFDNRAIANTLLTWFSEPRT
jgi:glycosyltransferase involved in cell wall biosynthesis